MALASILVYLADPQLVVWFQKLCGLEYQPYDDTSQHQRCEKSADQATETPYDPATRLRTGDAAAAASVAAATVGEKERKDEEEEASINGGVITGASRRPAKAASLLLRQRCVSEQNGVSASNCQPCVGLPNGLSLAAGSPVREENEPRVKSGEKTSLANGHSHDSLLKRNGIKNGFATSLNGLHLNHHHQHNHNHVGDDPDNSCHGRAPSDSHLEDYPRLTLAQRLKAISTGCAGSDLSPAGCGGSDVASQLQPCVEGDSASPTTVLAGPGASATCPPVLVRYPMLSYLAHVGAFLGNEEFYLSGLPLMVWMVDAAMMRQVIIVWGTVMYLGQAFKDYLQWPRPRAPPLVRLESAHLDEFSMPSTHATAGTAIPLVMATLVLQRYDLPTTPVVCMALLWFLTTCFSRLYLGVHTVLDLLAGIAIALVVTAVELPLISTLDFYQQTWPLAPLLLLLLALALATICYPSNHTPGGKSNAITISTIILGLNLGAWLNYQLGYSVLVDPPSPLARAPVTLPSRWWLVVSLLQLGVGVSLVFLVKVVLKVMTVRLLSAWCGLPRPDAKHPVVLVGYTYVTYGLLGVVVSFLDPLVFHALGFGREGYYREVV